MTENLNEQEPGHSGLAGIGVFRDFELQAFASIVDASPDNEMGITLVVRGTVLSGTLVGRARWHDLLAERGAASSEIAGRVLSDLRDAMADEEDDPARDLLSYDFLHLINGRIIMSDRTTVGEALWRVRISEVSAWTLQLWSPGDRE